MSLGSILFQPFHILAIAKLLKYWGWPGTQLTPTLAFLRPPTEPGSV
jgi:hypothetical protein